MSDNEISWGKENNIRLIGFNQLDPAELSVVKKMAGHFIDKIEKIIKDYDEIKVNLKIHKRNNLFLHEIKSDIIRGSKVLTASSENKNVFIAVGDCFESLINKIKKERRK